MARKIKNIQDNDNLQDLVIDEPDLSGIEISSTGEINVSVNEPEEKEECKDKNLEEEPEEKAKPKVPRGTEKSKDELHKEKSQKALALNDFSLYLPMPAQKNVHCVVEYRKGDHITDPYILSYLKKCTKPVEYL